MQTGAGTTCLALRVVRPHGEQRKEVGLCKEETSMATHRQITTGLTRKSSNTCGLWERKMRKMTGSPERVKDGTTPGIRGGQKTRARLS